MSDRGPTYLHVIEAAPADRPAILALLADHFSGKVDQDRVIVESFGNEAVIALGEDGAIAADTYIDNQDNYGNANSLLDRLIEAGATGVRFGLDLSDGVYTFRSRGTEKRVDIGDAEGELYVTQRQLDQWLAEPAMDLPALRAKLDEHFGRDWP